MSHYFLYHLRKSGNKKKSITNFYFLYTKIHQFIQIPFFRNHFFNNIFLKSALLILDVAPAFSSVDSLPLPEESPEDLGVGLVTGCLLTDRGTRDT